MNRIERVVVDECVGQESPLVGQLRERLGERTVKFVFLATEHPGIPDIEILDKLLDVRTTCPSRESYPPVRCQRGLRRLDENKAGKTMGNKPKPGLSAAATSATARISPQSASGMVVAEPSRTFIHAAPGHRSRSWMTP
jgi:hypothetical protein